MNPLRLVEPSIEYQEAYLHMISEWKNTGERMIPFVLRLNCSHFESFLEEMRNLQTGKRLEPGKVNSSTYWLVNEEGRILGAANIRHELNQQLLTIGGHIGYGIRPSERRKGYAARLLALALDKAKALGILKVLVTCDKDNIGSARTIQRNNGILDSEENLNGTIIQRYWIDNV